MTQTAVRDLDRLDGAAGPLWAVGDLAVWLQRLGLLARQPDHVAGPYRGTLAGRHREAASWWHQAGAVFDEAMARADSDDHAEQSRAVEMLDQLGAAGAAVRVRSAMRRAGVVRPHRVRGPQPGRTPPG